jgi:hypothetical protein
MADQFNNQPMMGGEDTSMQNPPEQTPGDEQSMRQDIERNLSDVESQNNALETKKFIAKNKIKNFKVELLRDIYAMMQKLGVDPANPESVKDFLLSLEKQDPDLLVLFQSIFDTLSPDGPTGIDGLDSAPVETPGAMPKGDMGAPEQMLAGSPLPTEPNIAAPVGQIAPNTDAQLPPVSSGGGSDGGEETPGQNLMDKYSNLQEGILR